MLMFDSVTLPMQLWREWCTFSFLLLKFARARQSSSCSNASLSHAKSAATCRPPYLQPASIGTFTPVPNALDVFCPRACDNILAAFVK